MRQNNILYHQTQSISIKSTQYFRSIVSVDIFSNIPLAGDGPKGLRFTIKNDFNTLDFFAGKQLTNFL